MMLLKITARPKVALRNMLINNSTQFMLRNI